jgi:hypothetical protein
MHVRSQVQVFEKLCTVIAESEELFGFDEKAADLGEASFGALESLPFQPCEMKKRLLTGAERNAFRRTKS